MNNLLCIGDVMLDVIAVIHEEINFGSDTPAKISTHGGGAAGNVASWATVSGAKTRIVARVGNDAAGAAVLSELSMLGVEHAISIVEGVHTGVVVILVDSHGERTMFPDTAANSGLTFKDLPDLNPFQAVYLSGYALINEKSRPGVLEMIRAIQDSKLPIFFDPTTVGGMKQAHFEEVSSWLPLMNTLILNEEEASFLAQSDNCDDALVKLRQVTPTVVIKRGPLGAIGMGPDGIRVEVPALPTTVVDTTGAGDAFAGGFIASWLTNPDMKTCMLAGALVAAECVAIVGARPHVTPAL